MIESGENPVILSRVCVVALVLLGVAVAGAGGTAAPASAGRAVKVVQIKGELAPGDDQRAKDHRILPGLDQ